MTPRAFVLLPLLPLLSLLPPASAGSTPLTVDDFLSFPTRANLVTGDERTGCAGLAAWIELRRGVRNVWMARPEETASAEEDCAKPGAARVTNFTLDDGQTLSSLALAPREDGACLAVVVVGPTASANPYSRVQPPGFSTWVALVSAASRKAAVFFPPKMVKAMDQVYQAVSPDGTQLAYVLSGSDNGLASSQVFSASISSNTAGDRFLFAVKQGNVEELQWNIDPKTKAGRILFSNPRGDHGFIGLWTDDGSPRIRWMSTSIDTDRNPRMSPDGTRVAFLRFLGPQQEGDRGMGGHRGPNFEVWVVDLTASSGRTSRQRQPLQTGGRMVYEELTAGYPDGGSGYGERSLEWLDETTLIFGDESSGWCHPVALDILSGKNTPRRAPLSPPSDLLGRDSKCEAKSWLVRDGLVWIVHNCNAVSGGDLDTRSISVWSGEEKAGEREGAAEMLFRGNASVGFGMSNVGFGIGPLNAGRDLVYISTTKTSPTAVMATTRPGCALTSAWELPLAASIETVVFPSSSSSGQPFDIHAQLFSATGDRSAKGTVVFTHGGSQRQMFPHFHFGDAYGALYALNVYIAVVLGHDVLSVNYRTGVGYGAAFRVCDECMWLGGAEYGDVRAGAKWLQQHYPPGTNIGVHGLSYGGLNCLQAMARDPDLFSAGVANAPVFNWISQNRYDGESFLDVEPRWDRGFHALPVGPDPNVASPAWLQSVVPRHQALAWASSPVSHVQNLTGPLLLIQGDADDEVAFSESVGLMRAVRKLGRKNVEAMVFPDETHGLARYASQLKAAEATASFLDSHLAGNKV